MIKIGILTWFHWNNFGTVLQAYALNSFLNQSGYDAETITFVPDYSSEQNKLSKIKNIIKNSLKVLLRRKNKSEQNAGSSAKLSEDTRKEKIERFDEFRKNNIRFSEKATDKSVKRIAKKYDYVVMGSDQIWHPAFFNKMYFGAGIKRKKLIAYAPSMGSIEDIEGFAQKKDMLHLIRRIPNVAIREKRISEHLYERYKIPSKTVVDPTFLISCDAWRASANQKTVEDFTHKRYLCVYILEQHARREKMLHAYRLAEQLNLQLVILPVFEEDYNSKLGYTVEGCGPAEFLAVIENAELIITDSFHGLVFCGIFKKKFLVIERQYTDKNRQQNERLYNLLEDYRALDCISKLDMQEDIRTLMKQPYEKMYSHMSDKIEQSKNYLYSTLKQIGDIGK